VDEGRAAQRRARAPREKSLWHYLGVSLSTALLVAIAAVAVLVVVVPLAVGGQALTVLTNSMAPGYPPGTLIVIAPTAAADIRVGDVLTFQLASGEPEVVTHRVVQRSVNLEGETTFLTKGDNNDIVDAAPVTEAQLRGTVLYALPWIGRASTVLDGRVRAWVVPVCAGLLFAYAAITTASAARDRRRRSAVS
jgi:signal peptidase